MLRSHRRELLLALTIVLVYGYFAFRDPDFATTDNLTNIATQVAALLVIATGMTLVILVRGIDLSVGASIALSSVVGGIAGRHGAGTAGVVVATLAAASLVGLANGIMVVKAGIAPFMVTLGTLGVCTGAALALSHAASIEVDSSLITQVGIGLAGPVPIAVVAAAVVALVTGVALGLARWGRHVYATGGNPTAGRLALVPVDRVVLSCYGIEGLCVGVASLLIVGRLGSAQSVVDPNVTFSAISAAIIGGTQLTGGVGTVAGTVLGVILLGVLNVGLAFTDASPQLISVVLGAVVIAAVATTDLRLPRLRPARTARNELDLADESVAVEVQGVGKRFGRSVALEDVSFSLGAGEVAALVGENGAGKTTLVSIIAGLLVPDGGHVVVRQREGGADGGGGRVSLVHQHLAVLPDLAVWENLLLDTPRLARWRILRPRALKREAQAILDDLGVPIRASAPVRDLTLGERQMLEISRAFIGHPTLVILDEATSAISDDERDILHALVRRAATAGAGVLYISHRTHDIYDVASRVIVLRDGRLVADRQVDKVPESELVRLTVGRQVGAVFPYTPRDEADADVAVSAKSLSDGGRLLRADLTVRRGEVVGVAGLLGAGRSELLQCLAGHRRAVHGRIEILGRDCTSCSARDIADLGVALVPEDRQADGLVPQHPVGFNVSLPWLRQVSRAGVVARRREGRRIVRALEAARVRPRDPAASIQQLSGGNQQKVLLARWLETAPRVLLLDEPTRGVDVGAKSELHAVIGEAKRGGAAIVMVSSELPELLGVSDRIIVMRDGVTVGELPRGATEEEVAALWFRHETEAGEVSDVPPRAPAERVLRGS